MTEKPSPEETIALAEEVGVSEAARRTGWPKATVGRWKLNGPPKVREAKPRPERVEPPPEPAGAPPSHARETEARDGTGETPARETPPGWRPTWMRKKEREALLAAANPPPPRLERAPTPDEVPQDPRLTPEQNVALHLLLCGYHPGEIAKAMGLSEWQLVAMRRDPIFREVHRAALEEVRAMAEESGAAWGAAALEQLYRIGMDLAQPAATRAIALARYLDRTGYGKAKRVEAKGAGGPKVGLPHVPDKELAEEEKKAREELRLLQGGRS